MKFSLFSSAGATETAELEEEKGEGEGVGRESEWAVKYEAGVRWERCLYLWSQREGCRVEARLSVTSTA